MKGFVVIALLAFSCTTSTLNAQTTWTIPHKDAMYLYRQALGTQTPKLVDSHVWEKANQPAKPFVPTVKVCSIPLLQPAIDANKNFTVKRLTPREMDASSVIKPAAPACALQRP